MMVEVFAVEFQSVKTLPTASPWKDYAHVKNGPCRAKREGTGPRSSGGISLNIDDRLLRISASASNVRPGTGALRRLDYCCDSSETRALIVAVSRDL